MSLPKINRPCYFTNIPSTKEKIKYYPFSVRDEQQLLVAKESKDTEQIFNAIADVFTNCIPGIDVSKLSSYDIEFLFIQLRARSIGEIVELEFICECNKRNKLTIPLLDIEVDFSKNSNSLVHIGEDEETNHKLYLELKYPTFDIALKLKDKSGTFLDNLLIKECIVRIIDEQNNVITDMSECSLEDFNVWYKDLHIRTQHEIYEFILSTPIVRYATTIECKCGKKNDIILEGMDNFFIH